MTLLEKGLLLGVLVIAVFFIFGCSRSGNTGNISIDVSVDEAFKLWKLKEALIIDIRTPEEYQAGHIPGVPLIPLDQLEKRAGEVPKDQKVLLICRSGNRSSQGTKLLRSKGFDNVYNVTGGMLAWRGPVER
ncbi:MAG: rhodanese-like domain-containing protein [Veillonellaceae bacterium]|jgi:phage shock protein E|nr:rhodanese-like domain-containing protein [Veillonellaceae bacterium]